MSTIKYDEGQEIVLGGDSFLESGFLHGQTVRILEARYGKLVVPPQYQNPKEPIPDRIAAKFKFAIKKQDGTEKVLEKAQEYSTGIPWDGDNSTATVSPDGKKLLAKKGFKGFSKNTDFYHLRETAINAGFPEDTFKGDLSVFDGLTFQIVSEKNPRAGENAKPKPFFGLLIGGTVTGANNTAPASQGVPVQSAPMIEGSLLSNAVYALSTMVAENGTISRRDVASKVPPIADKNGWDLTIRKDVMQTLFDLPKLQVVAAAAGLKVNGETVSA